MAQLDTIAEELATTLAAAHGAFCAEHPECGDEEGRLALHLVAAPVKSWLLRPALSLVGALRPAQETAPALRVGLVAGQPLEFAGHGLDPNDPEDGNGLRRWSRYTNLERYLDSLTRR